MRVNFGTLQRLEVYARGSVIGKRASQSETILLEATGISVAFDIDAASQDLVHLGILKTNQENWTALTLQDAVKHLNTTLENWFSI